MLKRSMNYNIVGMLFFTIGLISVPMHLPANTTSKIQVASEEFYKRVGKVANVTFQLTQPGLLTKLLISRFFELSPYVLAAYQNLATYFASWESAYLMLPIFLARAAGEMYFDGVRLEFRNRLDIKKLVFWLLHLVDYAYWVKKCIIEPVFYIDCFIIDKALMSYDPYNDEDAN